MGPSQAAIANSIAVANTMLPNFRLFLNIKALLKETNVPRYGRAPPGFAGHISKRGRLRVDNAAVSGYNIPA
jgi:hypothetical protein